MNVLVLNAGSSSLKFQVISTDPDKIRQDSDERLCRGAVERIGGEAIVTVETKKGRQKFTAPDLQRNRIQHLAVAEALSHPHQLQKCLLP